ncbi:hypothetical protein [Geothrix sp. SG200]|uniref:hypothetical protein n=1 Tax=Geothrix sp. SG200 TaxID=2922865 RepID=UPI001FABBF47|nr:hypothetical protein [Geothrix sp. SG200]
MNNLHSTFKDLPPASKEAVLDAVEATLTSLMNHLKTRFETHRVTGEAMKLIMDTIEVNDLQSALTDAKHELHDNPNSSLGSFWEQFCSFSKCADQA